MNTILQTPTNNLKQSLAFYSKLDFKVVSENNPTLISDGKFVIEINPDRFARAGVKLYASDWIPTVSKLGNFTKVIKNKEDYLLASPSGTWIYLITSNQANAVELPVQMQTVLGNFAGVSLETIDIEKSIQIWQTLGFKKTMGAIEQGWISFVNADGLPLSLMVPNACPHLFFNPSLSYFNGKVNNPKVIERIKALDIAVTEEITYFNKEGIVDNIIIRDPGGLSFFLFND